MRRARQRAGAVLALGLALLALAPEGAYARGGFRGGGFRSSPSSFRSFTPSRGSSLRLAPSSTFRSTKPATTLKGWGSATRPTATAPATTPRLSPLGGATATGSTLGRSSYSSQRKVYDSARRSGTLYSTKAEAESAFTSKYRSQYGSTFATEPASRPAWIPQTTTVGGRSVNLVYNPGLGGYGYLDPTLGRWILYDALADSLMLGTLMSHHNYYYGAPVYASHGPGFLSFAFWFLVAFIVLVVILGALRRRNLQ